MSIKRRRFIFTRSDYLVLRVHSSADGPSEVSERWRSKQRRERRTEGEATSSGSSPLSGGRVWLPTAPRTAPPAAHRFYESSMASQPARRTPPPPTPPPSPASSRVFPASSSGVEWMCAAESGPLCMTGPVGEDRDETGARWCSGLRFCVAFHILLIFLNLEYSTCKNCAKVWASLGFFFSNTDRRQDSTAASVVFGPSGNFCSDWVSRKAWCNSCWKMV